MTLLVPICLIAREPKPTFSDLPAPEPAFAPTNATPRAGAGAQASLGVTNKSSTNSMDALDEKHLLAIGDRLSFRIIEDEEDPKPLLVTDSGDLEVPYIGRFPAEGRSCKQLALALKAELEKEYYYKATVIIAVDAMTRSRGKVYLFGPVHTPGATEIPSDEIFTLSKAILRAGGFTDFADRRRVKVTRKSTVVGKPDENFTIDVGEILDKSRTELDLVLLPGDTIRVPERSIRF